MGHKVHPYGFRLGVSRTWTAKWYADKDYTDLLKEDITIRQLVVRRLERARHHGVQRDVARVLGLRQQRILVHHPREQRRIERAPVDADAHRLPVLDGHFDHGAEVVIGLASDIGVARIDAVLGQRARALRVLLEQQGAVVVDVADNRHGAAEGGARIHNPRDGGGGGFGVYGHAHQFRPGARQRHHLVDRGCHVGGIGVGHRLDDNRMISADFDTSHVDHYRLAARFYCHETPSSNGKFHLNIGGVSRLTGRRLHRGDAVSAEVGAEKTKTYWWLAW